MGFRTFVPLVAACPGCGRTTSTVFQELARDIQAHIRVSMPEWKTEISRASRALKVAVMGCIVNGPGKSKHADIGISLPGTGEKPAAPVFIDGRKAVTLRGARARRRVQATRRRLCRCGGSGRGPRRRSRGESQCSSRRIARRWRHARACRGHPRQTAVAGRRGWLRRTSPAKTARSGRFPSKPLHILQEPRLRRDLVVQNHRGRSLVNCVSQ